MSKYEPNKGRYEARADRGPQVTTLRDLEKYREGQVVELPPFGPGQPFVARLQRPSMLMLAKENSFPNGLLTAATRIFYKGGSPTEEELESQDTLPMLCEVLECIVKASLIEPSYEDIKKIGLRLTDDQMMYIFNYSQQGVEALKPFRSIGNGAEGVQSGEPVQAPAF